MRISIEMKPLHSSKLVNIQALRAFAAFVVVFVHLDQFERTLGVPSFGGFGVDLFFVISGFIMVYTTNRKGTTSSAFLRNRISRIVPIYYIMTFGVVLVAILVPTVVKHTSSSSIDLVKSLLFVLFRKGSGLIQPTLFVGWTLNYEMFFYVLFAVGLAVPSYKRGLAFTVAVLCLLAAVGVAGPFGNVYLDFYTSSMLVEFGFGMLIAVAWESAARYMSAAWAVPAAAGALVLSFVVLIVIPVCFSVPPAAIVLTQGIPAAAAVFSALLLESKGRFIAGGFIVATGDASYSLYLTHTFTTQAFLKAYSYMPHTRLIAVLMILATLAVVLAVAHLSYRLLEKPGTRALRRILFLGERRAVPKGDATVS